MTITNGAKDINDTHMIKFEVKRNNDVVLGKIAPGMKATAEIDIDLQKINGFVDIEIEFDNSKLNDEGRIIRFFIALLNRYDIM